MDNQHIDKKQKLEAEGIKHIMNPQMETWVKAWTEQPNQMIWKNPLENALIQSISYDVGYGEHSYCFKCKDFHAIDGNICNMRSQMSRAFYKSFTVAKEKKEAWNRCIGEDL